MSSALDKCVEIWSDQQRIAERTQAVGAMVVSVDVEDIGAPVTGGQCGEWCQQQECKKCDYIFHCLMVLGVQ